jgi:hypothetical protein
MKSILKLTAVITLSALISGCVSKGAVDSSVPKSGEKPVESSDTKLNTGNQGITVNKISFEEVSEADVPDSLKGKIETSKLQRGFIYEEKDGYFYIAIFSGEKPTGGYSIKVLSIEDNEGATNIFVEELAPKQGDMVTQAITYPYTVIKATGITPDIAIFNKDGSNFNAPASSKMKVIKAEVKYLGQIDNNSIEVNLDGKIVAMQLGTILAESFKNYIIEKDSMINVEYYENANGQYVVEYIEEKEY